MVKRFVFILLRLKIILEAVLNADDIVCLFGRKNDLDVDHGTALAHPFMGESGGSNRRADSWGKEDVIYHYVDIHFHADARSETENELPKVEKWMHENDVKRLVVLQYQKSMPQNEMQKKQILENFSAFQDKMYRFDVLLPESVPNMRYAIDALEKMKSEGAIGFGEHYGRTRYFDDPLNMRLYQACAEVGLPILFHMDHVCNMDDDQLSHLCNALQLNPKCIFIGHGPGFWKRMRAVDTTMSVHHNLYADISAGSGAKALSRDLEYTREFMIRHSDRVLFGTDGGPWSFGTDRPPQFSLVEALSLPSEVYAKLCWENALELFPIARF
jgi:predicted TIM-barrel fold metal-dependent hydrolase